MALFMKSYANYTILSTDAKVASWENKPSAITEITSIEHFREHLECMNPRHEITHRAKGMTAKAVIDGINHVWNFYNKQN